MLSDNVLAALFLLVGRLVMSLEMCDDRVLGRLVGTDSCCAFPYLLSIYRISLIPENSAEFIEILQHLVTNNMVLWVPV